MSNQELGVVRHNNPQLPYVYSIPCEVLPDQAIIISGFVPESAKGSRFKVELCCGLNVHEVSGCDDKALHFNPRFSYTFGGTYLEGDDDIVLNTLIESCWGDEERHENTLELNKPFMIRILILEDHFKIDVNGKHLCDFMYRMTFLVNTVFIDGDVRIDLVEYQGFSEEKSHNIPHGYGPEIERNIETIILQCKSVNENADCLSNGIHMAQLLKWLSIFSSCSADASLVTSDMPLDKFKDIENPHSLRASIHQLVVLLSNALRQANYSMKTVMAALSSMFEHFNELLEVWDTPNAEKQEGFQEIVNESISQIKLLSDKCKQMESTTLDKWKQILNIANTLSHGFTSLKTKVTYDMKKGTVLLVSIGEQWRKTIKFFEDLEILINNYMIKSVDSFLFYAKLDINKAFNRQALKSACYFIQVCNTAELYVEITDKYVIPELDGIGAQLGLSEGEAQQKFKTMKEEIEQYLLTIINCKQEIAIARSKEQINDFAEKLHKAISNKTSASKTNQEIADPTDLSSDLKFTNDSLERLNF